MTVDFSVREGVPLFKKFALFNSGIAPLENYRRDIHTLDGIFVDSLRVDLFFGNPKYTFGSTITGTSNDIRYDFTLLDEWMRLLDSHGITPYMSWCYMPLPLQADGDWRSGPIDLSLWQEVYRQYALHCKELGLHVYHEVYNEPDLGEVFFTGDWQHYLDLYRYGAKGLIQGDSEAVIGGPSTAIIEKQKQLGQFLDMVINEDLPLDFFSFHSYPQDGTCTERGYTMRARMASQALAAHKRFDTTELHMNELNTMPWPWPVNGTLDRSLTAVLMLQSFKDLLEETDLTLVHWAQWLSSTVDGLGMVEKDGTIKSSMHAYRMYCEMPLGRVRARNESDLDLIASSNEKMASVLIWNTSDEPKSFELDLLNIPYSQSKIEVFKLDDQAYNYPDASSFQLIPMDSSENVIVKDRSLNLQIGQSGILYIRIKNAKQPRSAHVPQTQITRIRHFYPDRGKGDYAEFNRQDWTAWLGMGKETSARSTVGIVLKNSQDKYVCSVAVNGKLTQFDDNSYVGIRIDYQIAGTYTSSFEYRCFGTGARNVSMPWGTGKPAEDFFVVDTPFSSQWQIEVKSHAPAGWRGEVIITFEMQNTGAGTSVVIDLRSI